MTGSTLYISTFLGVPMARIKCTLAYEIRILKSDRTLIGKYEGTGIGTAFVAAYWGFDARSGARKAYTDGWNNAFGEIRTKMQVDLNRLSKALSE